MARPCCRNRASGIAVTVFSITMAATSRMYDEWSVYSMTRASCDVNSSASTKKTMLTAVTAPHTFEKIVRFSASLPAFPAKRK